MSNVRLVAENENEEFLNCMTTAFVADPTVRYMWPEPSRYLAEFKSFANVYCGDAVINQTAWTNDNFSGGAAWLAPNDHQDEDRLVEKVMNTCPSDRVDEILGALEKLADYHPANDCWYLPMIGVDPNYQGSGYGRGLMDHMLEKIDHQGLPVYLESSSPRNIELYIRCGFEVMDHLELGGKPIITPMIRAAKKCCSPI